MSFKKIGIFALKDDDQTTNAIRALRDYLADKDVDYYPMQGLYFDMGADDFANTVRSLRDELDLGIAVGGDGTMLHLARHFSSYELPLIGINQGRLGFLTDISADQMQEELDEILSSDFYEEQRMLLQAVIPGRERECPSGIALNDIVITKGDTGHLVEYTLHVNDEFVGTTRGDGVILSTPTGSTAYALSAGGPILHPTLPAIEVVPLCPHTLSHRPIVLPDSSLISLTISDIADSDAHVFLDGNRWFQLGLGERVVVSRNGGQSNLIRACSHNHYAALRSKLGWTN